MIVPYTTRFRSLLKEKVGWRRWSAVIIGFLGVILILQPSGAGVATGAMLALVSAFLYALTLITSRQLSTTEPSHTILFYYRTEEPTSELQSLMRISTSVF